MNADNLNERLSQIITRRSQMIRPHLEVERYYGAVHRYLLGASRDPEAARELAQDFAVRFARGDFKPAPVGRFRDYLKTCLRHMLIDWWRRQQKERLRRTPVSPEEIPAAEAPADDNGEFLQCWRDELLSLAWRDLHARQQETGQPLYTVLRCKIEHPQLRSAAMAEKLAPVLGRKATEANVRQILHRARLLYAELLIDEVIKSLGVTSADVVLQELSDLHLLDYCRSAAQKRLGAA